MKAITGHMTTQMIEKYGREMSKRCQAKVAIVKLTDAKRTKVDQMSVKSANTQPYEVQTL